jgi:hypothetical protein
MKGPLVALIAAVSCLLGCTGGKEKEESEAETFDKMVILEEDPSSLETTDHRYDIR